MYSVFNFAIYLACLGLTPILSSIKDNDVSWNKPNQGGKGQLQ